MEDILKQFTTNTLFEATKALLEKLDVKFNPYTEQAFPASTVYKDVMTTQLKAALDSIDEIYFIGKLSEDTLQHDGESSTPESVAKEDEEKRYKTMLLFAMEAKRNINLTRSDIATLVRSLNRRYNAMPVMLFIRQGSNLSLASCERTKYTQTWRLGEKLGKVAILKDINCKKPHRGHLDILKSMDVAGDSSFEDIYKHWQKVFNSELLTKRFYSDLFDWYQWAVDPESKVSFPNDATIQDDDREDIDTKVIRLITRLMFVWFIKQKGLVPDCIFERKYVGSILKDFDPISKTSGNYYNAILQNLFFGTLNRAIIEDGEVRNFAKASRSDAKNLYRYEELFNISQEEVIKLFSHVPYMNCGLFECQDKTKTLDGVERRYYNDGFSRNDSKFKDGTYKYRAVVPNVLFFHAEKGLLSIFDRYVFTIEENTPQDVQVALDPELLGKVFENLLGAYNPETKETARNQSGSFYTPREIVQYMVNESLVDHLKKTVGAELEPQYRQLMDFTDSEVDLTDEQKSKILHALFTCKILDPACGSGAFPMGMLQQMVHILQQVDPDNSMWKDVLLNMAVEESKRAFGIDSEEERKKKLLEIEETFNDGLNSPDYTRKLYIIESCIYGVDIQPIAMLITRLRFFISLICEQKEIRRDDPEHNYGIKTLPNLESKFVAANSLINADIHKYNEDWTANDELALLKNQLLAIRHRHFYTRKRSQKIRLLREDEAKREQIQKLISKLVGEPNQEKIDRLQKEIDRLKVELPKYEGELWVDEVVEKPATLFDTEVQYETLHYDKNKKMRDSLNHQIKEHEGAISRELNKTTPRGFEAAVLEVTRWNPYDQNSVSPFLDIEWMFGLTEGFDIVIGNPPYIQLQNNGGALGKLYAPCAYQSFASTGDIYCLFYERGWQLLKDSGHLCYITSNKWMRAGYGEKLRSFLATKTNPQLLIDFGGVKVFESATVDTNILLFEKGVNTHKTFCAVTTKQNKDSLNQLSVFVQQQGAFCDFPGSDSWVVLSPIEQSIKRKIESIGVPLKDWDINIYRGVLTGYNEAFIISNETRDLILANCKSGDERKRTEELLRPILRGRDIKRFKYDWAELYLIATFPARHYDIEQYPAVKKYLLSFAKDSLCANGNTWVAKEHLGDFCKQKLAQSGQYVIIDGRHVLDKDGNKEKGRKKTTNKWFETQDSISYWEDFSRPKIIWKRIGSILRFSYDDRGAFGLDSTCFATGNHIPFICCVLNSLMGHYLLKDSPKTGTGDLLVSVQAIDPVRIPFSVDADRRLTSLLQEAIHNASSSIEDEINKIVFSLYDLTDEEIAYVTMFVRQSQQSQ